MAFVAGTFVLVLAIVGGLYWVFVEAPDVKDEAAVRRRLKKGITAGQLTKAIAKERERLSDVGFIDALLARSGRMVQPLQLTIHQSGLKVTVGVVVLSCLCAAAIVFALLTVYLNLPILAFFFGMLAGYCPYGYIRWVRSRRLLKFDEQFPEAMDLLARALRAGHALTTGLLMVSDELPEPIGPEFKILYDEQNFGLPMPQAMKNFAERIPSLDAKFFVTAVLTQRESGGNLSEVLDNLATIIRDRFRVKCQVRVISAHGRITGWVLSALPTSLGLFFAFTSPQRYRDFYENPLGAQMIAVALVMQVVGVIIISRIVKIEY
jgi:tight adherence protein B